MKAIRRPSRSPAGQRTAPKRTHQKPTANVPDKQSARRCRCRAVELERENRGQRAKDVKVVPLDHGAQGRAQNDLRNTGGSGSGTGREGMGSTSWRAVRPSPTDARQSERALGIRRQSVSISATNFACVEPALSSELLVFRSPHPIREQRNRILYFRDC